MNAIKQSVKGSVPPSVWSAWSILKLALQKATTPQGLKSMLRLQRYRNRHKGERCFIIGNGPSLKTMDLHPLRHEYTFGTNRIYLAFQDIGFTPTYYASVNPYVLEQCGADISALTMPRFLDWSSRRWIRFDDQTILVNNINLPHFSTDPTLFFWEGHTVTYTCMQLAYFMGFQTVILIGVDHNFVTKGPPDTLVVSEGDDPNHFASNYFGKGFRWQLPNLEMSEKAYILARDRYQQDGREILDATVGGKLTVFPKVAYDELFGAK